MVKIKKIIRTALILCLMFCASITANAIETVSFPVTVDEDYTKALDACSYLNEMRVENGRQPLIVDPKLTEVAMQRAAECDILFSHHRPCDTDTIGPDDLIPGATLKEGGLVYQLIDVGENIAMGSPTGKMAILNWAESIGHRGTMMDPRFKYCGIGCVRDDNWMWVLVLTDKPIQEGTVSPGIRRNTRMVDVDISKIKFKRNTRYDSEFGRIDPSRIAISDYFDDDGLPKLAYEPPANMLTFRSDNPEIFTLTPEGLVNPVKPGKGTMTVSLKNHPEVTNKINIVVEPGSFGYRLTGGEKFPVPKMTVGQPREFIYSGKPIRPRVTELLDRFGNRLMESRDYDVFYQKIIPREGGGLLYDSRTDGIDLTEITAPGTYFVVCKAKGNYDGSISSQGIYNETVNQAIFVYEPEPEPQTERDWTKFSFKLEKDSYTYTGNEICPAETVYDENGRLLKRGTDYKVEYEDNVEPGAGTVIFSILDNGRMVQRNAKFVYFTIHPGNKTQTPNGTGAKPSGSTETKNKKFTVKVKTASYTYTGKAKKPKVTVQQGKKTISSKYYTISYKDNKSVGTGTVTVKGKGAYKGCSGKAAFKIQFRKPSLSSVKGGKKALTLKWKKDTQAQGYQVQYSASSKFKGAKTLKVPGKTKTGTAIKSLKSKKTYYVRIRKYKKVGKSYRYSGWSSPKKAKTK